MLTSVCFSFWEELERNWHYFKMFSRVHWGDIWFRAFACWEVFDYAFNLGSDLLFLCDSVLVNCRCLDGSTFHLGYPICYTSAHSILF